MTDTDRTAVEPDGTAELPAKRAPRRLPPLRLRVPAWYDRIATHPDARPVSLIVTAVCVAASGALLVLWPHPQPAGAATPDEPNPTYTSVEASGPRPQPRRDAPTAAPTASVSPTPTTDTSPTPTASETPAETPTPTPTDTASPPPSSPPTSEPPPEEPPVAEDDTDTDGGPGACSSGGVTYQPGEDGYDECTAPQLGPGEPEPKEQQ